MKMNKKVSRSKWLAIAALLMFIGATFHIATGHFISGIICFGAAAAFTTSAKNLREKEDEVDKE